MEAMREVYDMELWWALTPWVLLGVAGDTYTQLDRDKVGVFYRVPITKPTRKPPNRLALRMYRAKNHKEAKAIYERATRGKK